MIILSNTTDNLQIQLTGSTSNQADINVSWRDRTATTFVAGRNVAKSNNTTSVDISGSPAASTQRIVDMINVYNNDSAPISFGIGYVAAGTVYLLWVGTLQANQSLSYNEGNGWIVSKIETAPILNNRYALTGSLAETFDRNLCDEVNTSVLSSGRLSLAAIYLPAGTVVSSISFWSATTAAGTPTNQLFGLFDSNLNLLRSSTNDTTTAWAANSRKTLSLTSAFTTTYSGIHYLGIMVAATTVPTLKGNTAKVGGQLNAAAPSMGGTSNTGLTTALPATANAPAAVTTSFWGCVS